MNNAEVRYIGYSDEYAAAVLTLANKAFGEGYMTSDELNETLRTAGKMAWLALVGDELAGYCIWSERSVEKIAKHTQTKIQSDRATECYAKSMAISEKYSGHGIATRLFGMCLDEATAAGFNSVWATAWVVNGRVQIGGIFEKNGFMPLGIRHNIWFDMDNYNCVVCGGRCHCDAMVYMKKLQSANAAGLGKREYKGVLRHNSDTVELFAAGRDDIPEIAEMYREIAITRENYKSRFDANGDGSFEKIGGMYLVHTEETLHKLFDEGRSFIAAARYGGRIAATFWCCEHDGGFLGFGPPADTSENENYFQRLSAALENGTVYYPRELIVRNGNIFPKLAQMMFYTIFLYLADNGYTHSLGEIYQLHDYSDNEGCHTVNMLNEKSYSMTMQTGCRNIGAAPLRNIVLDGFSVNISPQRLCFDYSEVLGTLALLAEKSGITVNML